MERRRSIVVCIIGSYISGLATSGEGGQAPEPPSVRTKIAPPLLFTQCPQGGRHLATSSPPSPPAPILLALIPLGLIASQHQSSPLPYSTNNLPQTPPPPLPPPLPTNSPPQAPHTTLSTRSTESIPRTPASHVLRCPTESTLRAPATQGLPHPTTYREPYEALSMLGVVYTCVHSCVHTCTVMYTRVYNRAFIPISF